MRKPSGYFVFRSAKQPIKLFPLKSTIAGWVLRDTWKNVQPSRVVAPDFSRLLSAAAEVKASGKVWQLEVFGGVESPAWVGGYGDQFKAAFINQYCTLVSRMGAAFAKDKSLVAVHATLPMHESPEFVLKAPLNVKGWQGFALKSNARALEAYRAAFPDVTIVIDLHNPENDTDGFVTAQIKQAKQILGKQLAVQYNAWNAKKKSQLYNLWREVKAFAETGTAGLEAVTVSTNERFGGSFTDALDLAKGVDYLIIYDPDQQIPTKPWSK